MTPGNPVRMAAEIDGDFVVYINGMSLNSLRAIPEWIVAGRKITAMLKRLDADPDSGLLGYQPILLGIRNGGVIQYWRSLEALQRFAHDPDGDHVPAWKWMNEEVTDGGVGFWAELYVVEDRNYETFYRDVEPLGLGASTGVVPMSEHRRRLGMSEDARAPGEELAA